MSLDMEDKAWGYTKEDLCTGVNIRILLIIIIVVNWTIKLIFFLHAVDFQGCFN